MRSNETSAACEIVIDYITELVASRILNDGDKLETERDLAAKLKVSRATVREAIKVLNYMGFVDSNQGSGNYITNNYDRTVTNIMRIMYLRGDIDMSEFTVFRQMLELQAFDLALTNATDNQKREMKQIIDLLDISTDEALLLSLDNRFHTLLVQASGNPLLLINFNALHHVTATYISETYYNYVSKKPRGYETLQIYHHAIVEALLTGQREKGRQAIIEHFLWAFPEPQA